MEPIRRTFLLDDLRRPASEAGVAATVAVQTVGVLDETRELLAVAGSGDLVQAVTGWVDLTSPRVPEDLERLRSAPGGDRLRGIRHQVEDEPDPGWLCREDVRHGLRAVHDSGLVYELLTVPDQLPSATETVTALPEASFVLDHCSKPPVASGETEPWAARLRDLATRPNVACKLSGLVTEASWDGWSVGDLRRYVDVVLDAFGPDRLMFGSDWPVSTLAASYGKWVGAAEELTADLSAGEREAIFGGTARRIYGIR